MSTAPAPVSTMTAQAFFDTITGYDEHVIRRVWDGLEVSKAGRTQPTLWMRSLAFMHYKRAGEADAKHAALKLSLGELNSFFVEDTEDAAPLQQAIGALEAVRESSSLSDAHAAAAAVLDKLSPDGDGGDDPGEAD